MGLNYNLLLSNDEYWHKMIYLFRRTTDPLWKKPWMKGDPKHMKRERKWQVHEDPCQVPVHTELDSRNN